MIHHVSHATGVYKTIKTLLAPDGVAIIFNGAPKHRFGAQEFEELLAKDEDLEHVMRDVPLSLRSGLFVYVDDCGYGSMTPCVAQIDCLPNGCC